MFPDPKDDSEPTLGQASQGSVVHRSFATFAPIGELFRPAAAAEGCVESNMDECLAEGMVAGTSLADLFWTCLKR